MRKSTSLMLAFSLLLGGIAAPARAQDELSDYSVRALIMQKIMVSVRQWSETTPESEEARKALPGLTEMNDSVRAFFTEYKPGGVILFANNADGTITTLRLISAMQETVTSAGAPAMLVAIDQEGGYVTRLSQGTSTAGNMALGALGDEKSARESAEIIGEELKALGFSVDFAPSLDVNCNPLNPIINVRSFGESPSEVSRLGLAFMSGLSGAGIVPAVKHFPGHGDTTTDSHSELPLVGKSYDEIEKTELPPFQAAIDAGAKMIMTAHIQYPALDDTKAVSALTGESITIPATLSRKIITELLREKMGFDGVVITDAMDMDAIAAHFGVGEAMIRAFTAGVDIALMPVSIVCPDDIEKLEAAIQEVEGAVEDGRLTREALEASVRRIMKLKEESGAAKYSQPDISIALSTVASKKHREIERETAAQSACIIANDGMLPLKLGEGKTLLLIAAYANEITSMRFGVNRLMREGKIPNIKITEYVYKGKAELDDELLSLIDGADAVILDSEISSVARLRAGSWQSDIPLAIIDNLNGSKTPYCCVSIHLPQDAALLTSARALIAVFNPSGMSDLALGDDTYAYGANLPAAMDVIFGAAQARGKLPVTIYALDENRDIDMTKALYPRGYSAK